jgi:hypothetical protein
VAAAEQNDSLDRFTQSPREDPVTTKKTNVAANMERARKQQAIREIQAAVARQLAAQCKTPKTVPQRIADLLRELHRRLREPNLSAG